MYIYLLCPHSEHQNKFRSNLNSLNTFTKGTSSPNKLKLPKIGSNAIVPVRVGAGPNKRKAYAPNSKRRCSLQHVIWQFCFGSHTRWQCFGQHTLVCHLFHTITQVNNLPIQSKLPSSFTTSQLKVISFFLSK